MRVLVLCKRQYMNRDLVDDHFGRFREIPLALARRGHEITGLCLSYKDRPEIQYMDGDSSCNVRWESINLGKSVFPGLIRFVSRGRTTVNQFRPDFIWAGSDSFYGPLALMIGRNSTSRVVFDIYDHFETFGSINIPGVFGLYRWACRTADGVTSFSEPMSEHIANVYHRTGPIHLMHSAVDKTLFHPMDKERCREILGLPVHARIFGTAGALTRTRGATTLFSAFEQLAEDDPDIHLAIAGKLEASLKIPRHPRFHNLGMLPFDRVPTLINALDVGLAVQCDTPEGRFGFPQKAYEMMACRIPLVAAEVGAMSHLLKNDPRSLYEPGNALQLMQAIRYQLGAARILDQPVPDWNDIASSFDGWLLKIIDASVLN